MMNKRNTIAAFSLIDSIIGMIITAIIMAIIFVISSIVSERMIDFKDQNQLVNDLNRLTYSFNKDIFEKEKMSFIDNEVFFKGYAGENVKYSFQENYILRINEVFIDTFSIKYKQLTIDTVKSKSGKLIFQKLKLNVEVNKNEMKLNFYKRVYANELIQKGGEYEF